MTADIHALTGAYALNAIPEFERAAFERHLVDCESCAQEVAELRATATRLGEAASEQPPAELKARVLARIAEVRQLPPVGQETSTRAGDLAERRQVRAGRSSWALRLTGLAAAALLVVSVSLGVLLVQNRKQLDVQQAQAAAMEQVLSANDARVVSGSTTSGLNGTVVVSRQRNQVLLLAGNVPAAPSGKDYQVWLMDQDGKARSVGLISPDPSGRVSILDTAGIGAATEVGVSVEAAGGSHDGPHGDVVMRMTLPV
ncbi:anti-sigma factor [Actinokineospora sp. NBRC 105648]|uniref:anti-sigma factor n=1 Tax=Actinokineospora sp. NBRC 105648 TaxID=3032206 RepID=UPI0024A58FD1|nr:anti-sigma factor [Actinokineospora sp. NBRC 105648]GLZ41710.1 hypothetical protein Acsp05_53340 [Actinokineospora sp. NBRC 105648]